VSGKQKIEVDRKTGVHHQCSRSLWLHGEQNCYGCSYHNLWLLWQTFEIFFRRLKNNTCLKSLMLPFIL